MYLSEIRVNIRNEVGCRWLADLYRVHQRLWMAFPDDGRVSSDPFFLNPWKPPESNNEARRRNEAGFLFRIERDGSPRILVQSVEKPEWEYAFLNAPHLLDCPARVLPLAEPNPKLGERFRFRLLANVVKSKSEVHPTKGKRRTASGKEIDVRKRTELPVFPHMPQAELPSDREARRVILDQCWDPWRDWLKDIGLKYGFKVIDSHDHRLRMQQVFALVNMPSKSKGGSQREQDIRKRFNAGLFEGVLACADELKLKDALITGIGPAKAFGFGLLSVAPV